MDCLNKLLILRFMEQRMFWNNTIILINGSAIERDTNAVQKFVSEKEAFFQGSHLSISSTLRFLYCWAFDLFNHSDYHRMEYEHFQLVIIIYKLVIQYILWISTLRRVKTT